MSITVISICVAVGGFLAAVAQGLIGFLIQRRIGRTDAHEQRDDDVASRVGRLEDRTARLETGHAKLEVGHDSIERMAGELRVLIIGASTGIASVQRTIDDMRDDHRRLRDDLPTMVAGIAASDSGRRP